MCHGRKERGIKNGRSKYPDSIRAHRYRIFLSPNQQSYELNAYEANLEDGFQTLTCTLYQLENHVWKNLEEVVFDLRSPTLEFALSAYLDTAMVSVQMNDEEN